MVSNTYGWRSHDEPHFGSAIDKQRLAEGLKWTDAASKYS